MTIKPFAYIPELDCFRVTAAFEGLVQYMELGEWSPVVFIGRYFCLDNDFGEHWMDNWNERAAIADKAKEMGLSDSEMMIIVPTRFKDDRDGPTHSDELRKMFWTDILKSMELSLDFVFAQGVVEAQRREDFDKQFAPLNEGRPSVVEIQSRIAQLKQSFAGGFTLEQCLQLISDGRYNVNV